MSTESFSQLVVVGSPAGGMGALSKVVSELPESFPAPVVIAQHIDPERKSHLQQILQKRSALPVRTISDQEPLEAGVIFVVPADQHIDISDSHIGMRPDTKGRPKPSIDLLLGTAADVFGERLIAVILTGTGADGTDGARQVSEGGGTVVIQNPDTARYGAMPASLAPNTVDIIADLDEIGRILVGLLAGLGGDAVGDNEARGKLGEFVPLAEDGEPMSPEEMPQVRASRGEGFQTRFAIRAGDGALRRFEARCLPFPDGTSGGGGVVVVRETPKN